VKSWYGVWQVIKIKSKHRGWEGKKPFGGGVSEKGHGNVESGVLGQGKGKKHKIKVRSIPSLGNQKDLDLGRLYNSETMSLQGKEIL